MGSSEVGRRMAVILVAIHGRALLAQDQGSLKCEPCDVVELIRGFISDERNEYRIFLPADIKYYLIRITERSI